MRLLELFKTEQEEEEEAQAGAGRERRQGVEEEREQEEAQVGRSMVFLRKRVYERLEAKKVVLLRHAACAIQKMSRGLQARKSYRKLRWEAGSWTF